MVSTPRTDLADLVDVAEVLPWTVTPIATKPYPGFWFFNPCLHLEPDGTWICVLRCADYSMPGGNQVRGPNAKPSVVQTKSAMVVLDGKTWRPIRVYQMRELDEQPRVPSCPNTGYEDMRIFRTELGGLQGIAASLHLERPAARPGGSVPPEQVLLSFDDRYNIVEARPLRGTWGGTPQKNWMPFEGTMEPLFLFSVDRGVMHDCDGPVVPDPETQGLVARPPNRGVTEVKVMRPPRAVSAGRVAPPTYGGIRGGSQLVHVGDDQWLGVGHEMRFVQGKKFYWHTLFLVDADGQLVAKSGPVKLAPKNGIEFAAGLAIEDDRAIISFGVDDEQCWIGETSLAAVLELVRPLDVTEEVAPSRSSPSERVSVTDPRRPRPRDVVAGAQRDAMSAPRVHARAAALAARPEPAPAPDAAVLAAARALATLRRASAEGGRQHDALERLLAAVDAYGKVAP